MIVALDTDVLVHWCMQGAGHHLLVRQSLATYLGEPGARVAVTPQCLSEFVHVVTDSRRFPRPMTPLEAIRQADHLWRSEEVVPVLPTVTSVSRTFDLMTRYSLGRKRILDTALAATLECAGIGELWTFNDKDFALFTFLRVVNPSH